MKKKSRQLAKMFLVFIGAQWMGQVAWAQDHVKTDPLPNWIDESREKVLPLKDLAPVENLLSLRFLDELTGPPDSVRLPPEYAPVQAVVIGWAAYTPMLRQITEAAIRDGGAKVWIAGGNPEFSADINKHVQYLDCPIDSVWARDYGPFGVTSTGQLYVVDTVYRHFAYRKDDDRLPTCMAENNAIDSYKAPIILDGGNVMVNGQGELFMTAVTYKWNRWRSKEQVDQWLKEYFKVTKIHVLDYAGYPGSPADGTGHIDMFVKLLSDDTVLIAQTEDASFKAATEKAVEYFKSIKTPNNKDYQILRLPGWVRGGAWYTYTNSLIVNNTVLVPTYRGKEGHHQMVQDVYAQGMPGIKVNLINSDGSITAGGSIHCVTQQVPALE